MKWLDPLPVRIWGAHIDRETVLDSAGAGGEDVRDEDPSLDIVKRIEANTPEAKRDCPQSPQAALGSRK